MYGQVRHFEIESGFDSDTFKSIEKIKNETNIENLSCISLEDMLKEMSNNALIQMLQLVLNKLESELIYVIYICIKYRYLLD